MEVKSASTALQLNSAASAVENGSSGGNNRQHTRKIEAVLLEEKPEQEEESVKVSISAAGMRESRAGGNGISFTKNDNVQLSQKMNDLTRMINEAAVYHRNASAVFMVKNRQTAGMQRTFLDIAI